MTAAKTRIRMSHADRRVQIIAAANEEFRANGYQGARTKSIAQRAGITEPLIYQHFNSKQELFAAAVVAPLEEVVDKLGAVSQALPPGTDDQLRESTYLYVKYTLDALLDSAVLFGLVLFSNRDEGEVLYERLITPLLEKSVEIVKSNENSWSHRPYDIEFSVRATFGMIYFLAVDAAYRKQEVDSADVARKICELIFDGLSTKPASPDSVTSPPPRARAAATRPRKPARKQTGSNPDTAKAKNTKR